MASYMCVFVWIGEGEGEGRDNIPTKFGQLHKTVIQFVFFPLWYRQMFVVTLVLDTMFNFSNGTDFAHYLQ